MSKCLKDKSSYKTFIHPKTNKQTNKQTNTGRQNKTKNKICSLALESLYLLGTHEKERVEERDGLVLGMGGAISFISSRENG